MKKIVVPMIALSLLLSGMLLAVGGEATDRNDVEEMEKAETEPTEIHDWHDLDAVRDNLDGDYVLMNDLDEDTDGYDELVDTEEGWEPIGRFHLEENVEFTGTFYGKEREIRNLSIHRPDENHIGLFGATTNGAEIVEIGIVDANVIGEGQVGGLLGENGVDGRVINSYVEGHVSGESIVGGVVGANGNDAFVEGSYFEGEVSGDEDIGGLVGINGAQGTVESSYAAGNLSGEERVGGLIGLNSGTISKSYATIYSTLGENLVGGLVGYNVRRVRDSYAQGDVSGVTRVGGLIGENVGSVLNSYARGDVSGDNNVGGLVGYNDGTVSKSYATGRVSGDDAVGGLIGDDDKIVMNSFWNVESTEQEESDGGTGKTTDEMKHVGTYTDTAIEGLDEPWDFLGDPYDDQSDEDIWDIDEDEEINDGYPFFVWDHYHSLDVTIEGEGTVEIDPDEDEYKTGSEIDLTAIPDDGWEFVEWTRDVPEGEEGEEITITMDEDREITAVFEEEDDDIPGFTSPLLLLTVFVAIAIYRRKER